MRFTRLGFLLPLLAVAACGQSLQPLNPFDSGLPADDLAVGGDGGGSRSDLGMATIDMAGFNQAGSPVVMITAPTATTEVQGDTLNVTATITSPTNTPIKADTVSLAITPPGGAIISAPMSLTATANVYSGNVDISAVPSGNATFTVSAADTAGLKGSANGMYIHDHGATITFVQPSAPTAHGQIVLEAIIDDTLHPITMLSQVKASIRAPGDITLTQVAGAVPFRVTATIDLNSFSPSLDGPQLLTIQATNSNGTKTTASKQVTVDNAGPTITNVTPAAGAFVGGVTKIEATITDISGVADSTVIAVFGGDLMRSVSMTRLSPTGSVYTGFFDVRSLGKNYVLPELSIRADDTLGNHGELGEEIIVDNTPPWMNMNAAIQMRVSKPDPAQQPECSRLFSPLGDNEAAKEGDIVQQVITLRARVEDHGNLAPGLLVERISTLDPSSVTLFAIPDSAGAVLAVDTDGDGECDDVNPTLIPTSDVMMSGEALALAMAPLAKASGTPDYRAQAGTPTGCNEIGEAGVMNPPLRLCSGTNMYYVVPPFTDPTGAIFSVAPVSGVECVGLQLDSLNRLPEGPTCVITRAVDRAGNQNVSYPLHICIDRGGGLCTTFTPTASDCTGKWDKVNQKLLAGTCNPPTEGTTGFPLSGEVRDLSLVSAH